MHSHQTFDIVVVCHVVSATKDTEIRFERPECPDGDASV